MSQNYSDAKKANVFKIAILFYIKENNFSFFNKSIEELAEFIYRFVRDLDFIQNMTSNVILQNITKYIPTDLMVFLNEDLLEWIKAGNGYLDYNNGFISSNYNEELSLIEHTQLKKVIDAICMRTIGKIIDYNSIINILEIDKCKTIDDLKKTRIWNRATECTKFCMCCDENNINNLYMAYIFKTSDDSKKNVYTNPNNTIVLCKKHVLLYESGYFRFDHTGRIIINRNHEELDSRMRISKLALTKQRKHFLELANT